MLDQAFQALADPTRRAVVERLCDGPASVSELAQPFPMTLAAVVQHVQVLEAAGLVSTHKVGRVRHCELRKEAFMPVEKWIAERKTMWEAAFDRLGEVLAEPTNTDTTSTTTKKRGKQ